MNKRKINRWLQWLIIYPLSCIGAVVTLFIVAMLIDEFDGGRIGTVIARMSNGDPYYEYGYSRASREREKTMAEQMKTWDSSYQIFPWEELSTTILRGEMPKSDFGCIYKEHKNCPGCHEPLMKIHHHNGWLTFCPNCRNQLKYKQEKQ